MCIRSDPEEKILDPQQEAGKGRRRGKLARQLQYYPDLQAGVPEMEA